MTEGVGAERDGVKIWLVPGIKRDEFSFHNPGMGLKNPFACRSDPSRVYCLRLLGPCFSRPAMKPSLP